ALPRPSRMQPDEGRNGREHPLMQQRHFVFVNEGAPRIFFDHATEARPLDPLRVSEPRDDQEQTKDDIQKRHMGRNPNQPAGRSPYMGLLWGTSPDLYRNGA